LSTKGGPVFTFSLPGKGARHFAPVSYATGIGGHVPPNSWTREDTISFVPPIFFHTKQCISTNFGVTLLLKNRMAVVNGMSETHIHKLYL